MTEPTFTHSMRDGDGREVRLSIMPRIDFPGLGWQTGLRLETVGLMQNTIGLSDWERRRLIKALTDAGPLP